MSPPEKRNRKISIPPQTISPQAFEKCSWREMTVCMIQCNDVNQSDVPLGLIELWLKISARVALFGSFGPLIVSGGLDSDLHIIFCDSE